MKKNKFLAFMLIALLMIQALTSCQLFQKTARPLDTYMVFLAQNSVGSGGDLTTPVYNDWDFYKQEFYSNSELKNKTIDVNGKTIDLYYDQSMKVNLYDTDFHLYEGLYNEESLYVRYHAKTGKMTRFVRKDSQISRDYLSELSPSSSEKDYLEYVKEILWKQAGVLLDGREMVLRTTIIKNDGSTETFPYFVNNSEENPDFCAKYKFTFCSYVDGIKRADDIEIVITNFGELFEMYAYSMDAKYRPYQDLKIDQELLTQAVYDASPHVNDLQTTSRIASFRALPTDSELLIEALVEYYFGEVASGAVYLIKVAELE